MNLLRLQMTRLHLHMIWKILPPVQPVPGDRCENRLAEEAVVVGENEAFYLKGASPDCPGRRWLEETGTSVFALKVMSALTRKSVNRVKNTAIGRKAQRKNPENAGTIGRQKHPVMSLMTVMNNLLDLTPAVLLTIIAL